MSKLQYVSRHRLDWSNRNEVVLYDSDNNEPGIVFSDWKVLIDHLHKNMIEIFDIQIDAYDLVNNVPFFFGS